MAPVMVGVRPSRPKRKTEAWEAIAVHAGQIKAWLDQGLTMTKVHTLLGERGVVVPYRSLLGYATAELHWGRRQITVPVPICEPGSTVQVVFGRLGMLPDESDERRRVVHGLIFTAVYSQHMFVYPTWWPTLGDVIAGFEAAWAFFGGVFPAVVCDDIGAIVNRAYATDPILNETFGEYAQVRGFAVELTGIGSRHDRPRVERSVSFVRSNFYAGAQFRDLDDCRAQAEHWCAEVAGMRVHSTNGRRPAEVFFTDEQTKLKPAPDEAFDIPTWTHPRVAPDGHVRIANAFYSVPGELVGQRLDARVDARTVQLFWRGELIKVHPVVGPGLRRTDPADPPPMSRPMR
ncbi:MULTISPECIES: hypothetical protein [Mycobacterium]|uniref:Mu transposase domain-containing protein n=1 Tax=Mycobacterium sp. 20KCMC460 TaxID=2903536 RepID=UPI001EE32666|nr:MULTISPECIES: hypothetical protein [Mycobacterium]